MAEVEQHDLLAVTFVKCETGEAFNFKKAFVERYLDKEWRLVDKVTGEPTGSLTPTLIAYTAGYFDFIVVATTGSAACVAQFCLNELRSKPKGLGDKVLDTQTTIGVLRLAGD